MNRPQRADWQRGPKFGSPYTFMRVPATRDLSNADVAILGLPFDAGTMYRPGARFGPRGIRDASGALRPYSDNPEDWRPPFTKLRVVDYGDLELDPNYIAETLKRTEEGVGQVLRAGVLPICLGGDHSLSLATVRAAAKNHGKLSL